MTTKNSSSHTNPFSNNEPLQEIFEQTHNYNVTQDNALIAFKASYQKSTFNQNSTKLNSIQSMLYRLTHLTRTALTVLITLLTSSGAVLTQVYADEQYKPLTIAKGVFQANKQPDPDPKIALQPDDSNYLVFIEPCDLAVKYPKTFKGYNLEYNEINYSNGEKAGSTIGSNGVNLGIICPKDDFDSSYQFKTVTTEKIELEELKQKTGWFTTTTDLQDIKWENISENGVFDTRKLKFNFDNKTYIFSMNYENLKLEDFANIQVQFKNQLEDKKSDFAINNKIEPNSCGSYKFNTDEYTTSNDSTTNNYKSRSIINATSKNPQYYNKIFITLGCDNKIDNDFLIKNSIVTNKITNIHDTRLVKNNSVYEFQYPDSIQKSYTFQDSNSNWINIVIFDENGKYIDVDFESLKPILLK
jgi:hypothetical protein